MEIKPTKDEAMDYNRYRKIPLGFYESKPGKLEPLDNAGEIRNAARIANALQSILDFAQTWGWAAVGTIDGSEIRQEAWDALRATGRLS